MTDQLQLYVCEHFKADTLKVLSSANFSDVKPLFFPARCGRPMPANKQLSSLPLFKQDQSGDKYLCGCSCLSLNDKTFLNSKNIKQLYLDNCFKMFAPEAIVDQLINDGAYIVTPDWLTKWRIWVKQWGEKEQVRQMFSESIAKIVFLDTGVETNSATQLKDFSEYIKRPSETVKIGLDYYRFYLENKILKWRLSVSKRNTKNIATKTQSDFAMALDLIANLPRTEDEEILANGIMEILIMMFAAQKVRYVSVVNSEPKNLWSIPAELEKVKCTKQFSEPLPPIRLTDSGKGFCVRIANGDNILAVIEIDDISLPENISKYQNLAIAMADVFALSIENSRFFKSIVEMNITLKELNVTKDKLFSIIAHDLRSPFNSILGFSDHLIENLKDLEFDETEQYLEIINTSAQNTLVLLDNLLNWAKSQTGQISFNPQKIVLSSIFDEIIEISNSAALAKKISLLLQIEDEVEILADENMLKTILRNLISNAIKFTKPGGKIIIAVKNEESQVEFTVSDNGVGMNNETINKLFRIETNESTKGTENEKGSGLGLILCKDFVEKHKGKIWLESELGEGSIFYFTIPHN